MTIIATMIFAAQVLTTIYVAGIGSSIEETLVRLYRIAGNFGEH